MDEQRISEFVRACGKRLGRRPGTRPTFAALLQYLRQAHIIAEPRTPPALNPLDRLEQDYAQFLQQDRALTPATLHNYLPAARRFLVSRFGTGKICLRKLGPQDLTDFILHDLSTFSPRRMQLMTSALRSFLGFLYQRGDLATNLAVSVPTVANWNLAPLPRFLEPAQVEKLLSVCDRTSPVGKRNHAILLLLARLGLRAGEVVQLTLEDIDWEAGELLVRGKSARQERLEELLDQRLYGLVLGYEDLNDHDTLRHDPLLAVAVNKREPLGEDRVHAHPPGVALAGSATLNRLELGNQKQDRTHKIQYEPGKIEECLLVMGVRCLPKHAAEIVIDLDGMGHLVHGMQEGRHFNAYYDGYCFLPLYAFVGTVPLLARLRPGDVDAAEGVVDVLEKLAGAIRKRCKWARIIVRGDSAFAREEIMVWCEAQKPVVYCCLGLGPNSRLVAMIQDALATARGWRCLTGAPSARQFKDLEYRTRQSWSP